MQMQMSSFRLGSEMRVSVSQKLDRALGCIAMNRLE